MTSREMDDSSVGVVTDSGFGSSDRILGVRNLVVWGVRRVRRGTDDDDEDDDDGFHALSSGRRS